MSIRVVGCPSGRVWNSSGWVWLFTWSSFRQRGGGLIYLCLGGFFHRMHSSLRDFIASSMDAWKTPSCCWSWMLSWLPRGFSSLFSTLFCKAVPGVGGTVWGVLKDKDSKCKGWGRGGNENKLSAAPPRSAWEPENASISSRNKSILHGISFVTQGSSPLPASLHVG